MELLITLCRHLIVKNVSDTEIPAADVLLLCDSKGNTPFHLAAKMADESNQHDALDVLLAALIVRDVGTDAIHTMSNDMIKQVLESRKNNEGKSVLDLLSDCDRQIGWLKRAEAWHNYYKSHPFDEKMSIYRTQSKEVTNLELWKRAGDTGTGKVDEFLALLHTVSSDDSKLCYVKDKCTEPKGNLLFNAVKCNNHRAVAALLEKGVDITTTDHRGFTVFHQAIENVNYQVMFMLVRKYGSRDPKIIAMESKDGVSTLNLAIKAMNSFFWVQSSTDAMIGTHLLTLLATPLRTYSLTYLLIPTTSGILDLILCQSEWSPDSIIDEFKNRDFGSGSKIYDILTPALKQEPWHIRVLFCKEKLMAVGDASSVVPGANANNVFEAACKDDDTLERALADLASYDPRLEVRISIGAVWRWECTGMTHTNSLAHSLTY